MFSSVLPRATVSEPRRACVPARLRRLERLALCHPLERLPGDEELAVIQTLCRALLRRADRRQFRGVLFLTRLSIRHVRRKMR